MSFVSFERWSRNAMSRVIGFFSPVRKVSPESVRQELVQSKIPKILFIRPHQGLGDLLLATPIFRALKETYPSCEIHFLADTYNQVAVHGNPQLKRVWVWNKRGMQKPWKVIPFFAALRKEHFDLAIVLTSHIPSFTSFLIARFSGARRVWAFETEPFYDGANWSRFLAHVELPNRPEKDPEWVKFMDLIKPLQPSPAPLTKRKGTRGVRSAESMFDFEPEYAIPEADRAWARQRWQDYSLPAGKRKVGVFLGGNPDRPERLWPPDFWLQLVLKLQQEPDLALIGIVPPDLMLSGSGAMERGVFADVSRGLTTALPNFSDRQLVRVAAFLQGLDLFICVDGGLFHIAVASRVTTLGLFFMTDPARWSPPVPWATVLRPADDRPTSLPPDEVHRKVRSMMLESSYAG